MPYDGLKTTASQRSQCDHRFTCESRNSERTTIDNNDNEIQNPWSCLEQWIEGCKLTWVWRGGEWEGGG